MNPFDTRRTAGDDTGNGTPTPGFWWEFVRLLLGSIYVLGALSHLGLGLLTPEVYTGFADRALVAVYPVLWESVVVPNLWFLQPLVVGFEFGVGLALLYRGRAVRAGHAAGAGFQAALVLSGPWGPVNALLALVHLAGLRVFHPATVGQFVRQGVPGD